MAKDDNKHAPIKCQKCGGLLAFIEYGHKMGSNGKMAKWPIYEKCQNPACAPRSKNRQPVSGLYMEEVVFSREPAAPIDPKRGKPVKAFQLTSYKHVQAYQSLRAALLLVGEGCTLRMHIEDAKLLVEANSGGEALIDGDDLLVNPPSPKDRAIRVKLGDIRLTRKFRYFIAEEPAV